MNRAESGIELEKKAFSLFRNRGWVVEHDTRSPSRPDMTLHSPKGYYGVVEVKSFELILSDRRILGAIEKLLSTKPDFLIITNCRAFELYIKSVYYGRLSICPSPDDIDLIINSLEEGQK